MDLDKLLQMAKECELGMKHAYDHFAESFQEQDTESSMWKKLAHDEAEHMKLLTDLIRALSDEQRRKVPDLALVDPIEKQIEFMTNNPYENMTTLNGALSYTKKLEDYEVSTIVQMAMKEQLPNDERINLLHKQLSEHYGLLQKYFEESST